MDETTELYGKAARALEQIEGCREFAALIPEVRTNLVYARTGARTREDVLGVDGRITVVDGMPHAAGRLRFGVSSHMARLLIEIARYDPSIRAGINFASNPGLVAWLHAYCQEQGWTFGVIDRSTEPPEFRDAEEGSMPWKVAEAVRSAGGRVPVIFYETGAVGKEPVSVLVGTDPMEIVGRMVVIARRYRA